MIATPIAWEWLDGRAGQYVSPDGRYKVYRLRLGGGRAIVRSGIGSDTYLFSTVADALRWCEQHAAGLVKGHP